VTEPGSSPEGPSSGRCPLDSTATLLRRAKEGNSKAREELFARYLPRLQRWAHGRSPRQAGNIHDTDDFVQMTLSRALSHLGDFQPQHDGAFFAYLRKILLNQIRDQVRRNARRPQHVELDPGTSDPAPSPLELAIGKEMEERYELALENLSADQRAAVVMRLEGGFTYQEIADELGRPSADAARQLILRALIRLAGEMHDLR